MEDRLNDTTVICLLAEGRGKRTHESHGLILIRLNQSQKVETMVIKWVATKCHTVYKTFMNSDTVLYLTLHCQVFSESE